MASWSKTPAVKLPNDATLWNSPAADPALSLAAKESGADINEPLAFLKAWVTSLNVFLMLLSAYTTESLISLTEYTRLCIAVGISSNAFNGAKSFLVKSAMALGIPLKN